MTEVQPTDSAATTRGDIDDSAAVRAGRRLAEVETLSGIGSWEWDIRSNEVHWSEQLCRVYGVEPDPAPITYEDFLARVHPDDVDMVRATVQRAFETGGSFVTEHRAIHPDGRVRTILGRGHVLTDEAGIPFRMLGSGQDVTDERIEATERAAEMRRTAASEARDDALALIVHDLRSPLAVIIGYVQLLERQAAKGELDPERLAPYLTRIGVAAGQMTALMDDLLADASPEAPGDPIDRAPADLAAWLRDLVDHQAAALTSHAFVVDLPDAPVVAEVNPQKLERAVVNLITNAVKYSVPGTTVRVALSAEADGVRIAVTDEGIGIPAADLPHVFERFHRGANVSGRVGGLGLGLTSVSRAVEAHGGRVTVESTEGTGTTFTIHLPPAT